ncbi:MAG TPA: precorrin-4 C(11)-methyltransferase [Methanoregulaceae archaeon]|nr:precorrin-4 C(11)-methyltransferase [Methanoregulaceae archaeon]HPD75227.1 precorrin-4 C(11)-methyltransferase [Methanoregulaceae archaeon]
MSGEPRVFFVGAGPGDPDLITVRGRQLLDRADVLVYAGSLVNPALVGMSPAPIRIDSWGMALDEIVSVMERHANAGRTVVRLHSGDPSIFGAIIEQMDELKARGVAVEIIPGVSSLFAAAAALQIELVLNGVTDAAVIARPAGKTLGSDHIPELSATGATLAIFLGTDRFDQVTKNLRCAPDTPAAVVYHASWPDQKIVRGTVADIAEKAREAGITKTALLLVGKAVDPQGEYRKSHLYS